MNLVVDCINKSLSSYIFLTDLPSYGLITFVSIGLILYLIYMIFFIRNRPSTATVYIYFSQLTLFFLLLSPLTFLFRPSIMFDYICSIQTLSFQILPFCFLLGFNVHFLSDWLRKLTKLSERSFIILFSTFLIFFLLVLIQTVILISWFYYQTNYLSSSSIDEINLCTNQCSRSNFLYSLLLNFLLLIFYSFQSTLKYHFDNQINNFIHLLASLFALIITIIWLCLYLYLPTINIHEFPILAYGILCFVYTFLGPFVYEQIFSPRYNRNQINRLNFKCLSLTKDQQREYMAAYIKRNLTASCENLTSNATRNSTLSVESLCPTLISTISSENPSNLGTLTSEYLLLSTSIDIK